MDWLASHRQNLINEIYLIKCNAVVIILPVDGYEEIPNVGIL
jgi:hypothetical protein